MLCNIEPTNIVNDSWPFQTKPKVAFLISSRVVGNPMFNMCVTPRLHDGDPKLFDEVLKPFIRTSLFRSTETEVAKQPLFADRCRNNNTKYFSIINFKHHQQNHKTNTPLLWLLWFRHNIHHHRNTTWLTSKDGSFQLHRQAYNIIGHKEKQGRQTYRIIKTHHSNIYCTTSPDQSWEWKKDKRPWTAQKVSTENITFRHRFHRQQSAVLSNWRQTSTHFSEQPVKALSADHPILGYLSICSRTWPHTTISTSIHLYRPNDGRVHVVAICQQGCCC